MSAREDHLKACMMGSLDGDASSHAALLSALVPTLGGFYRRRLSDSAEIEDLVQETLIAVHLRRASYDRDRPFTPWLYAIARHKMIDHYRREGRHGATDELNDVLKIESFEDTSNAGMDVERLLGDLPPKQADAIRNTKLDGLSTAEAAKAAGISEADVKISVYRGLKVLAARIRGDNR